MLCDYLCYMDARLLLQTEALFNEFFWPQASTIASLYCLYLWHLLACKLLVHDLIWWAHQLVHTGDDSVSWKSPVRLDAEKLEEGINALPRELLGLSLSEELLKPRGDHSLSLLHSIRNKKQMLMESSVMPTWMTVQDPRAVALIDITHQKAGLLSSKPRPSTRTTSHRQR